MSVFLVGMRGAGKTTVGRLLADRWGWLFVDLDEEIAREQGVATASQVLQIKGVGAFRAAEERALKQVLKRPQSLVALGGGTLTIARAHELIRSVEGVWVVYLRAAAAELQVRLRNDANVRPGLMGPDPIAEVPQLLAERESAYLAVADVVVDTDGLTPAQVVAAIHVRLPLRFKL